MGEVSHLFVSLVHRFPPQEVSEIRAIVERGFEGCIHGRPGSPRQVLLIEGEVLEALGLRAGAVKENITTRGLDLRGMRAGRKLRVGEALLETTIRCDPCFRMDEIRPGLKGELRGQRGWLCRVVEGGKIRRGDRIALLPQEAGEGED